MKIDPSLLYRDELTNTYNRRYLRDKVSAIFDSLKQKGKRLAVLFLDIDKFKEINDTWGHSAGDQALIEFTNILKKSLRKKDILVRYGGDEFVIILPNTTLRKATEVAKRIIRNLSNPANWVTRKFMRKTSIGIAVFPKDSEHLESLIEIADTRMYCAKKAGTGFLCYSERFPGTDIYDINVNLVGREHIFKELVSLMKEAKNGKFINVLLEGPSGTGKGELLNYLAEKASSDGFLVVNLLTGFSQRFEQNFLIKEMFKKFKEILTQLSIPQEVDEQDFDRMVENRNDQVIAESATNFIRRVSKWNPLFIGISNIENVESRTLKLFSRVFDSLKKNTPLFVIQTYDEQSVSLKESAKSYIEHVKAETKIFKIHPYTERETSRLLELLLGGPVPDTVVKRIQKVSRGYPTRIKHVLNYLHRLGVLKYEDGRWIFESGYEAGIQNWLQDYIKDTFSVLTSRALEILKALAILKEVEIDYLYKLLDGDRLSFYESLSDLSFYGLISYRNGVIRLSQERIGEIVKKELLKRDPKFQRFLAEEIVEIYASEGEGSETLLKAAQIFMDIGEIDQSVSIVDTILDRWEITKANIDKITDLLANFENVSRFKKWSDKLLKRFNSRGDYELAGKFLNNWRKRISRPGVLWTNLLLDEIQSLLKGGRFQDVLKAISENYWFIKRNGDYEVLLKILFLKGKALEFTGDVEQAKSVYSRVKGLAESRNLEPYRLLGLMAFVNLNFESNPGMRVSNIFTRHIEPLLKEGRERMEPRDWFVIELAKIYANMDSIDSFLSVAQENIDDYFTLASLLYLKSEVFLRLGKFEESLEYVRTSRRMFEKNMPISMVAKHYVIEALNLFLLDRKEELRRLNAKVEGLPINKSFSGAIRALNLIKQGETEKAYRLLKLPTGADSYLGFYYRILNFLTFLMIESGLRSIPFDSFKRLERESNGFTPIEKVLLYFNGFAIGFYTGRADKCSDYLNRSVYWIKKTLSRASDKRLRAELLTQSPYVRPVFQRIS